MYVVPRSEIKIGNVLFYGENSGINAAKVTQSVVVVGSSGEVTIARNFKKFQEKGILENIAVKDKITIRYGYDNDMRDEFIGYITEIGDGTPIVLKVDDEWYLQKKKDHISKSWASATLKEVLIKNIFCMISLLY
jgi:hypothetical protein